jgi:hypothetical protein
MKNHDCCDEKSKPAKLGGLDPFIIGIISFTLIALIGVVYWGTRAGATAPQVQADTQASLAIESNRYDWGVIDINGGMASYSFPIRNQGETPLKLFNVTTSCMCTTAQLIGDSNQSEKFGMHEKSSAIFEVQPGETAQLLVEFDPAFHGPSGVGQISRTITLNTNDPGNSQLTFQLSANVVKN